MSKNYCVYPCEILRITQTYMGTTSHYPHTVGSVKDYPFDEGCKDSGRSWLLCPCDEIKVVKIYGVGNGGTNTIWLVSTTQCYFPDGTKGYLVLLVTHPDDDDLRKLKVGQTFKRGEKICREGKDGATANHFHISAGKGKMKGTGWAKNARGKWVLTATGGTFKPEKIFYIDPKITTVVNTLGLNFKTLPKSTAKKSSKYTIGNYKVSRANVLKVRTGAGADYPALTYSQLTDSAKNKILAQNNGKAANGYVKGMSFTVKKVVGNWGKTASGWVHLGYCKKI